MNKPAIDIIEDEIPAARLLHSMIARLRPEWDITVIPGSVEEATEWFATHAPPHHKKQHKTNKDHCFQYLSAS